MLLEYSEQALADKKQGKLSQAFCDVVDAIIAGGGMVGGLGERYTRVAAAHSVHNGLTVLPQTEAFLHGTKVAYGIWYRVRCWGKTMYWLNSLQPTSVSIYPPGWPS